MFKKKKIEGNFKIQWDDKHHGTFMLFKQDEKGQWLLFDQTNNVYEAKDWKKKYNIEETDAHLEENLKHPHRYSRTQAVQISIKKIKKVLQKNEVTKETQKGVS